MKLRHREQGIAALACILIVILIVVGYVIIRVVWKCCKVLEHPHGGATNEETQASTRLNIQRQPVWMAGANQFYRLQNLPLVDSTNAPPSFDGMVFSEVLQGADMPAGHTWDAVYYVTGHITGNFASTTVWTTNGVMVGTNFAPVTMTQE